MIKIYTNERLPSAEPSLVQLLNYRKGAGAEIKVSSFVFSGGEVQVKLDWDGVQSGDYTIEALLTSSQDFMELVMVTDAMRRAGHRELHLLMKYVPYARQDRVMNVGEALSIRAFADLINALQFKSVTIWDPHSDVTPALLNNVVVVDQAWLSYAAIMSCKQDVVLVAPDAGAMKKTMKSAKSLGREMITAEKIRDTKTGEITGTRLHGSVAGNRDILILDDLADGGRTFIELGNVLRNYTTGKIMLYVTHGIFSQGFDVFKGKIDEIYVANLWPNHTDIPDFVHVIR